MKVVLPDNSELELPEGATGLDAARSIGPKLAEQAVLVRANGQVQDLRLPLQNGQLIQILTTRDRDDPDALYVLRHSSAHLLAEAVRRLYPGVKVAIGPPIENGFYYDFEFPEPISEDDLPRIEEEIRRELEEGRDWTREEVTADEARKRFEAEGEPYKVELVGTAEGPISFYTQGDFTDLCRGPHLQNSSPIKAIKLTGLAGAYWRGDVSTAPPSIRRPTSTHISHGSKKHAGATTESSDPNSTSSTLPRIRRAHRSGIRRGWWSGTSSRTSAGARTRSVATSR
jgi:threonyl-tRNA synthetase